MQIHRVIPLSDLVLKKEKLEAREKRVPRIFNGPKAYIPRKSLYKRSDSFLLEVRRLYEYEELELKELTEYLQGKGVIIAYSEVSSICQYTTRSHLVPDKRDAPYWPE